ncbi:MULTISPECIES: MlaD family protein [Nocardia]|uniref:MlaD family protein n=1 Tax=Nocardia TaxID=1817 RepID=UPI0007EA358C|nr:MULTISPECIES: MlaD family protein [Nocardia]MBF6277481.1 MCE family protein [Nocardia nova]OBB48001.1 mammalian cell entry protein [Nocardia sp. 852002-51244_SCH5132740]OBF66750.1 mammalian cell entry protein [Mycobacterium sp. 852002-51759_SCH5129042]PPI99601.1 MCE family protein [Nocardia nova]
MSPRTKMFLTLGKLATAAVLAVVLFSIILSAIKNPVRGDTRSYSAEFTDVSGLHVNGDIRTKGVRIGKVSAIDLTRRNGASTAEVTFSLEKPYELRDTTVLAVKYQNLTGIRYVDLEEPEQSGRAVHHLGTDRTRPSFDITQLFNGLQPVLSTMSTDEVNTFMQNAITLLQGDGTGLAPMLDSVQKLTDLAHDREQVISTLVTNLSRISDSMGGKSPQVMEFMKSLSFPIAKAMTVLGEFPKTAKFGPEFLTPVHQLITELGFSRDVDVDKLLTQAFASLPQAADALRLLPVALAGLQMPQTTAAPAAMNCTHGIAELPTEVEVLLNGSEVVVCKAH